MDWLCAAGVIRRWRGLLIASLLAVVVLQWTAAYSRLLVHSPASDFKIYYDAAMSIRTHSNPYYNGAFFSTYDPPGFELSFIPFTYLSPGKALIAWNIVHIVALVADCWLLARLAGNWPLTLLLVLLFPPVLTNFDLGQSKLEVLCLILLFQYWLERGYERAAAMVLTIAALWRIFPVFLFGYLAVRRLYRALVWSSIWLALGTLVTIVLVGWTQCLDFLLEMADFERGGFFRIENNCALSAVILRQTGSYALVYAMRVVVVALTIGGSTGKADERRIFSLWVAAALVLLPIAWPYDMVFMLVPLATLMAAPSAPAPIILIGISYLTADSQTWLLLFGQPTIGLRLMSFLFPLAVHSQWLSPVAAFAAAWMAARGPGGLVRWRSSNDPAAQIHPALSRDFEAGLLEPSLESVEGKTAGNSGLSRIIQAESSTSHWYTFAGQVTFRYPSTV